MLRIQNNVIPISSILFSNKVLSDGDNEIYYGNLFATRKQRSKNMTSLNWLSYTSFTDIFAIMDNNDDLFIVHSFTKNDKYNVVLSKYLPDQYVLYMCKERSATDQELSIGIDTHENNLVYYITKYDICMLLPDGYTHAKFNSIIVNKDTDSNDTTHIVLGNDRMLLKFYKDK